MNSTPADCSAFPKRSHRRRVRGLHAAFDLRRLTVGSETDEASDRSRWPTIRAHAPAKFMLPWSFPEEGAAEKHMAQLQHNMWVDLTWAWNKLCERMSLERS